MALRSAEGMIECVRDSQGGLVAGARSNFVEGGVDYRSDSVIPYYLPGVDSEYVLGRGDAGMETAMVMW